MSEEHRHEWEWIESGSFPAPYDRYRCKTCPLTWSELVPKEFFTALAEAVAECSATEGRK